MIPLLRALGAASALLFALIPPVADAATQVFNADLASGTRQFDTEVAALQGPLHTLTLQDMQDGARQFSMPGLTITGTNGAPRLVDNDYAALRALGLPGALSGEAIGLVPTPRPASSGLHFHFAQPVNAFGLEIGDWGSCCFASSLAIAFEGGATLTVATARSAADNPGWRLNGQYTNFIGAIAPDTGTNDVTLYAQGLGDYIVAGGTLRWALAAASERPTTGALGVGGSIPAVPELQPRALLLAGLIALPWLSRRRQRQLPVRQLR